MMKAWLVAFGTAVVLMGLAGCATIEAQSRTVALTQRAKTYVKAIRWGEFDTAAGMHRRREGANVPPDLARIDGVRVTNDEHTITQAAPEDVQASMRAVYEYHRPNSARVRTVVHDIQWWYDEPSETWFVDGDLPAF